MTGKKLLELVQAGATPLVRFNSRVEELEYQFESGMIGRVLSVTNAENAIDVKIDESDFREYNLSLEKPMWRNRIDGEFTLRFSEIDKREDIATIYDELEELINFEIIEDESLNLFNEYLENKNSLSYIQWLEQELLKSRSKN
jgi:hypothetical protein